LSVLERTFKKYSLSGGRRGGRIHFQESQKLDGPANLDQGKEKIRRLSGSKPKMLVREENLFWKEHRRLAPGDFGRRKKYYTRDPKSHDGRRKMRDAGRNLRRGRWERLGGGR